MFGRKYKEKEILYKARIKELENLLCPGEMHDFKEVEREIVGPSMDGHDVLVHYRLVCARCYKAMEYTREE